MGFRFSFAPSRHGSRRPLGGPQRRKRPSGEETIRAISFSSALTTSAVLHPSPSKTGRLFGKTIGPHHFFASPAVGAACRRGGASISLHSDVEPRKSSSVCRIAMHSEHRPCWPPPNPLTQWKGRSVQTFFDIQSGNWDHYGHRSVWHLLHTNGGLPDGDGGRG